MNPSLKKSKKSRTSADEFIAGRLDRLDIAYTHHLQFEQVAVVETLLLGSVGGVDEESDDSGVDADFEFFPSGKHS